MYAAHPPSTRATIRVFNREIHCIGDRSELAHGNLSKLDGYVIVYVEENSMLIVSKRGGWFGTYWCISGYMSTRTGRASARVRALRRCSHSARHEYQEHAPPDSPVSVLSGANGIINDTAVALQSFSQGKSQTELWTRFAAVLGIWPEEDDSIRLRLTGLSNVWTPEASRILLQQIDDIVAAILSRPANENLAKILSAMRPVLQAAINTTPTPPLNTLTHHQSETNMREDPDSVAVWSKTDLARPDSEIRWRISYYPPTATLTDQTVPLCMEKSHGSYIAAPGVSKTGGAWCPVHAQAPEFASGICSTERVVWWCWGALRAGLDLLALDDGKIVEQSKEKPIARATGVPILHKAATQTVCKTLSPPAPPPSAAAGSDEGAQRRVPDPDRELLCGERESIGARRGWRACSCMTARSSSWDDTTTLSSWEASKRAVIRARRRLRRCSSVASIARSRVSPFVAASSSKSPDVVCTYSDALEVAGATMRRTASVYTFGKRIAHTASNEVDRKASVEYYVAMDTSTGEEARAETWSSRGCISSGYSGETNPTSFTSNGNGKGGYQTLPRNIRVMNCVPGILHEVPRGKNPSLDGYTQAPRKQRTRNPPKDLTSLWTPPSRMGNARARCSRPQTSGS
ncbi:hypothetical protein FB107DRAFT_252291 [Schizophyllum commune]